MPKFSIKTKLVILVFVITFPIFTLHLYHVIYEDVHHAKHMADDFVSHRAKMVADQVDLILTAGRRSLITFSEITEIKNGDWDGCRRILSALKPQYPHYENIFVIGSDGWTRCSAVPQMKQVYAGDRPYFIEAMNKKGFVIGEVLIGRITGKPVVVMAYPVLDKSNRPVALIGASLTLLRFHEILGHLDISNDAITILTDEKGRILTSNIKAEEHVLKDVSNTPWFQAVSKNRDCCLKLVYMDEERLTASASPTMVAWHSIIGIPTRDIYAPLKRDLWKGILFSTLILITALFIAKILGKQVAGPIMQLSQGARDVSRGDFKKLINIKTGDEIEKLAGSFNEMVKKLDEKKVENEKLQKQLFLSQKMEAIGTLTGGIAHDFNNMLNVILGYAQLVIDEAEKDSTQRRYIQQIQKAGQSAAELVQQLLAFSRRQVIDPKIISINDVVQNLVKMLHRIIGEHIALKLSLSDDISPVMADTGQMVQVIMNLCVNARDAMPEGGELAIETSNTIIDEEYCQIHPWAHPGFYALLSITDTGIGMDSETQARIFEPFFTTKELGKGTGLGLAIVYGIIKQHNGLINVYSQKGYGTTFKIYLPSASGKPEAFETPWIAEVKGGKETILLAEDNDMLREYTETILKDLGYTVIAAKNGDEAIKIFTANSDKIQLTVLDVIMPVCSGREAYERMRDVKPDLKVIFTTGYSIATHHTESIAKEKLPLLQKPFSKESLARKVREALDSSAN